MNNCILTAQILSKPIIISRNKKTVFLIRIAIPNNKKKLSFCKILICIEKIMINHIYNLYATKDICILEGHLEIKYNIIKQKYIYLKLNSIQPYLKDKDY